VTSLENAAEVVEAIDDHDLQLRRDWDLSGWQYELIPWGVRFRCDRPKHSGHSDIFAVLGWPGPHAPDRLEHERPESFVVTME